MLQRFNYVITILFFVCYSYQFLYIPIAMFAKKAREKKAAPAKTNVIAVLIAARNEEAVIGQLIDSVKAQDYPQELIDVFVVADNCTDGTARIAREKGAFVCERFDKIHVGKGYALNFLLRSISESVFYRHDAYLVLDADNVLAPDFITRMNETFSEGYDAVTCYRNSKNFSDNWISAGYGLWFLRESQYLNRARMEIGSSCAVSGTGFMFSDELLQRCGGWKYYLLTEDIEFTIDSVVKGARFGYAEKAVLYDEQPVSLRQSFRQRLRWARGYMQVFFRYCEKLFSGIFAGSFSCYDMTMNIAPAAVLTGASIAVNGFAAVSAIIAGRGALAVAMSFLECLAGIYGSLFVIGLITTLSEWNKIYCPAAKKILYCFTFPLFMLTYVPICFCALFVDPGWKPIEHRRSFRVPGQTA